MVCVFDGMLDLSRRRTIARARIQRESLFTYDIPQIKPPLTLLPYLRAALVTGLSVYGGHPKQND